LGLAESLALLLAAQVPRIRLKVDDPFIELKTPEGEEFTVECFRRGGYGLSSIAQDADPSAGYGQGADEVFEDALQLVARVRELFELKGTTQPDEFNDLRRLRLQRGVTQFEMARRLGIKQPTVSRLERQTNIELATLVKYVEALGGKLTISAKFEGEAPVSVNPTLQGPASAAAA
jgi:DNA-binding XRE family transcriptional regulator